MKDILEAAARHKMVVNFHGATVPRGWQRTYPNFVTNEDVYGAEWYNNVPTFTDRAASHNATLPFTRNVVASMDYTPCAFSDSQHPHITTMAHELALTALFESGIQHLADRPESFLAQPQEVRDYLTELPTVWDETLLLDGYPGEFVVMGRRIGDTWWVAAINGTGKPIENLRLDLSRLDINPAEASFTVFEDAGEGPSGGWKITASTDGSIKGSNQLPSCLNLYPRGGAVIKISKNTRSIEPKQ